ncbi:MAG: FCD domain-containing protein [Solirubrobacteraceae bacterium]
MTGKSSSSSLTALARLRAEGLVLAEPRRGHVVAPLTLRDVGEVHALRLLLEPAAAAAAAEHMAPASLAQLRAAVATPVDVEDPGSVDRFMDASRGVHVTVAGSAGNRRLAAVQDASLI